MQPHIELMKIKKDPKHVYMKNHGYSDLIEFLDATFVLLKVRLLSFTTEWDDIFWLETRFYATYLDHEQCKLPYLHSFMKFGVSVNSLRNGRGLSVYKRTIQRIINIEIHCRFMCSPCEALDEINAFEVIVNIDKDYPPIDMICPKFD